MKVLHPLGNVCQAQQAADLRTTFLLKPQLVSYLEWHEPVSVATSMT